ncbi:uncharacterized protein JCM6883_005573 [Sporobolomyces salmoneus]|uniref:uncharacterized protein n=1 Tax=Sporobolomyces salmoneus TaxID=183962 RepID=UPI00317A4794
MRVDKAYSEMDHLSRLPSEILDLIFELAASTTSSQTLTTRPISKPLLPSQERALYGTITLRTPSNSSQLLRTLDAEPQKARHTKELVFPSLGYFGEALLAHATLLQFLPNSVEGDFHRNKATTLQLLSRPELIVLDREREGGGGGYWPTARQVLRITIQSTSPIRNLPPSKLLQFFPSASISCLETNVADEDPIHLIFDALDIELLSLHLGAANLYPKTRWIDHLLPEFSKLQHVHLDSCFASPSIQTHLLNLPNLVSVSLSCDERHPNLDSGTEFDFVRAEEDFENLDDELQYDNSLSLLENKTDIAYMRHWRHPWEYTILDVLPQVVEMEKKAKAAGLFVESNLPQLIRVFHFQIVELYNRGVGNLYFYGNKDPLRYALSLTQRVGIDIDRLQINLEDDFDNNALKWFQVRVNGVAGCASDDWCRVYGLRLETQSEFRSLDQEEGEDDDSDQE